MSLKTFVKDPAATLYYGFDWTRWLGTGETISTEAWTVPHASGELVVDSHGKDVPNNKTFVRIHGGTAGADYTMSCLMTTTPGGDVDSRSMTIQVRSR